MPRGLIIFLLVCALIAGGTVLARQIRLAHEKAARYAHVIASCANGRGFTIEPSTAVLCYSVETR